MRVLIAIPTYNRADMLGPSLDSIGELVVPNRISHLEVVVIDNNCTDGTKDVVIEKQESFRFPLQYFLEVQQGLCFGRNRALALAQAFEHLILFDDDIWVHPHWLEGYCECLQEFNADCVVGPVYAKFSGESPPFLTEKARRSLSSPYSLRGDAVHVLERKQAHHIPGCNFGFRVAAGNLVQGFDTTLDRIGDGLLAGGDSDFGRRLVAANQVVAYHPQCAIDHLITAEKVTWKSLRRRWRGQGATKSRIFGRPKGLYKFVRLYKSIVTIYAKWALAARKQSPEAYDLRLELDLLLGYATGKP